MQKFNTRKDYIKLFFVLTSIVIFILSSLFFPEYVVGIVAFVIMMFVIFALPIIVIVYCVKKTKRLVFIKNKENKLPFSGVLTLTILALSMLAFLLLVGTCLVKFK